jgi:hypothetical protein
MLANFSFVCNKICSSLLLKSKTAHITLEIPLRTVSCSIIKTVGKKIAFYVIIVDIKSLQPYHDGVFMYVSVILIVLALNHV